MSTETAERRRPGRPSKGPRVLLQAWVRADVKESLVRAAEAQGTTMTDLVTEALRRHLSLKETKT